LKSEKNVKYVFSNTDPEASVYVYAWVQSASKLVTGNKNRAQEKEFVGL